ncbi:hypothetical protein CCP3SC1AL1_1080003 [Gammaproteobacteria bacterium]
MSHGERTTDIIGHLQTGYKVFWSELLSLGGGFAILYCTILE